jgi:hypothetical protein
MELIDKFHAIAARGSILKPFCMQFDKPYPIMSAEIQIYKQNVIIRLALKMADDDFELGYYNLPRT